MTDANRREIRRRACLNWSEGYECGLIGRATEELCLDAGLSKMQACTSATIMQDLYYIDHIPLAVEGVEI